jgi:hypothetical protein
VLPKLYYEKVVVFAKATSGFIYLVGFLFLYSRTLFISSTKHGPNLIFQTFSSLKLVRPAAKRV